MSESKFESQDQLSSEWWEGYEAAKAQFEKGVEPLRGEGHPSGGDYADGWNQYYSEHVKLKPKHTPEPGHLPGLSVNHKHRHQSLHKAFDELLADWIRHTENLPSKSTVSALMEWSSQQTQNPTEVSE